MYLFYLILAEIFLTNPIEWRSNELWMRYCLFIFQERVYDKSIG